MRPDLQNRLSSTRPTRGALVATLFAIIVAGMVVAFGFTPEEDLAIDAGAGTQALVRPSPDSGSDGNDLTRSVASTTSTIAPGREVEPTIEGQVVYEVAMAELGVHDATSFEQGVLSSGPEEPDEAPSAPTTAAKPTTTAAPAPTPTVAEDPPTSETASDGETTTTAGGDTSSPSDSTDTTAPPDTTPETTQPPDTSHPDGYVDAGHGVFVPPVLLEIRRCESTNNYSAANPSSSARGAYQFLTGSWAAYGHAARYGVNQAHLASPAQQDEAALITWQKDGTRPWNASRSCWG